MDCNHVLGFMVLKDPPCGGVTSQLTGIGVTLDTSLTSVSGNMGCIGICMGISHPKSSILFGFSLNLAAQPNCL